MKTMRNFLASAAFVAMICVSAHLWRSWQGIQQNGPLTEFGGLPGPFVGLADVGQTILTFENWIPIGKVAGPIILVTFLLYLTMRKSSDKQRVKDLDGTYY